MYIRHIDHRSGAPWAPQLREGGNFFSRQSREFFFREKGPHGGPHGWAPCVGPMGGPHGGAPWGAQGHGAPWGTQGMF